MRTAVVTGGSRGIGTACVRAFAQAGWRVAFLYRSAEEAAQRLAAETGTTAIRADVSGSADVAAACGAILGDFKHVDALVNNAGVALTAQLQDVTDAQWHEVLGVNLTGAFYMTRALLPQMISQGRGRIVNVASIWGMVGGSMEAPYSAAKAGLIGLTKALAKEAGPSGITVNAVAPGATRTDMLMGYGEDTLRQIERETPLGRLTEPEEVARAVLWLCGDEAAMITGQVLCISGGSVIV